MFVRRLVLWATAGLLVIGTTGATDDPSSLEAVVQTLSQQVTQLAARLEANHNELQELKKLQPSVIFSVQNSNYKFTVNNGQTVIFDNALMNQGGGYSTRHGEFTAPVSGLYYLSYRGWGYVRHAGYLIMKVNDHTISALPFGDESNESASSQSLVVHMSEGDVLSVSVSVSTTGSVMLMGEDRTSLMGYLIKAD
ncbi:hypothetical protein ACOMHN_001005 [Nucella lapillus]